MVIAEKANPPVAKILDFNKFLYEERKKASSIKAKSKKSELKEFRIGPTIGDADLEQKIKRARKYLQEGNRVKVSLRLRGREKQHPEVAFEKIDIVKEQLADIAKPERPAKNNNGNISIFFISS